ncbi:STAS domain-containing protein [bacterium]|nr:STAS domain-containing protein [bacterium]MBU1675222.1 STAS domain-containing protein [bacterium]
MNKRHALSYERIEHDAPSVLVFRLSGYLHGSPLCFEFLEAVRDEVHAGHRNVVVDLSDLDKMNSTGVGVIAACYTSLHNAGGALALTGASDRIRMMLEVVCLWDLIGHYDSVDEAIAAFG